MTKKLPRIGMRIIKSSSAVLICLILSGLFRRDNAFYSTIAALYCIQSNIDQGVKLGLTRIFGSIIGGVLGVLVVSLTSLPLFRFELYSLPVLTYLAVSLSIVLTIYVAVLINQKQSAYISCVVLLCVVIFHNDTPAAFAVSRVIDTIMGIVVGTAINYIGLKPIKQ